ncbi:MAG: hypothetical protein ONB06_08950, partial [candidate division KSB1 bacterium]|nr:hypothetical protein [candidate division KSB1 bacterium]
PLHNPGFGRPNDLGDGQRVAVFVGVIAQQVEDVVEAVGQDERIIVMRFGSLLSKLALGLRSES